jgi:hypothetical protein
MSAATITLTNLRRLLMNASPAGTLVKFAFTVRTLDHLSRVTVRSGFSRHGRGPAEPGHAHRDADADAREQGLAGFLDDKSFRPGLGTYERR